MRAIALIMALCLSGCAQTTVTIYNDATDFEYTTIKVNEGTKVIVTKGLVKFEKEN